MRGIVGGPSVHAPVYAAGHFSKSLLWSLTDLAAGFHLHFSLGLSFEQVGTMLCVALAYGGTLDAALGLVLAQVRNQRQAALGMQLACGVLTAGATCVLFAPGLGGHGNAFAWGLAALLLFHTCYAVYDVSLNALTALLPQDREEAARLVRLRAAAAPLAKLLVGLAGFVLLDAGRAAMDGTGGALIARLGAAAAIASCIAMSVAALPGRSVAPGPARPGSIGLPADLSKWLGAMFVLTFAMGLSARFMPFALSKTPGQGLGAVLTLAMVAGSLAAPVAYRPMIARMAGERSATAVWIALTVASTVGLTLPLSDALRTSLAFVYGLGLAATNIVVWSGITTAVRAHAARSGRRIDLTCFAFLTASIKLALAGANLAFGHLMGLASAHGVATVVTIVALAVVGAGAFMRLTAPALRA